MNINSMNIITINNLAYIVEKDSDETIEGFNLRVRHILKNKPQSKKHLDKLIHESYLIYNKLYLKCEYFI